MGNIDSERDWGHAQDYVEGMWLMLQQDKPDDFVLATGRKISVRKFIEMSFSEVGITIEWKGKDDQEKGYNKADRKMLVEIDPKYYRPSEVDLLVGDASKAKEKLAGQPNVLLNNCVRNGSSDLEIFKRDKYLLEVDIKFKIKTNRSEWISNQKIYIAGHRGMVGSAIHRNLQSKGYTNFILKTSQEIDLRDQVQVSKFLKQKSQIIFFSCSKSWRH